MPASIATANTARALLALVESFGPTVEDGELVFALDPPTDLEPALSILHTGVRAVLTGQRWWGSESDKPCVIELNPVAPLAGRITLLCVEGDQRWDRIHPTARIDLPQLFAPEPATGPSER